MKVMGYNYAAIHVMVHIVVALLLYVAVQPDLSLNMLKLAIIAAGTAVVDLDHVFLWKERGIRGYLKLRSVEEYGKPRRYKFHNFMVICGLFGGSLLIVVNDYYLIGLFFAAALLHTLWDLIEDLVIFRMGYGHWI
jgi:hypothetical protein